MGSTDDGFIIREDSLGILPVHYLEELNKMAQRSETFSVNCCDVQSLATMCGVGHGTPLQQLLSGSAVLHYA